MHPLQLHAENILAALGVAGAIVTILGGGGVLGWWWRKQPERERDRERNAAVADAILGEPEVTDRSGEVIQPARPGLVHRVGTVEEAVIKMGDLAALITEALRRIDTVDARVQVLERATVERLLTKAESAAMWKAVADRDVIDGSAEDEPPV